MFLFAAAFLKFGFNIVTPFVLFWISCLIIMTVTDLKTKLVDCNIAILTAISGLIYCFISSGLSGLADGILGMLAGILVVELIARFGYLIVKERAMGEADTYVAGALGAISGIRFIFPVLLYGLIASMFFILPVFLYNRYKSNDKLTCIMSILFISLITASRIYTNNLIILIALILSGIILAISVLLSIKDSKNQNILPYVPALGAGFLYFLFFVL